MISTCCDILSTSICVCQAILKLDTEYITNFITLAMGEEARNT